MAMKNMGLKIAWRFVLFFVFMVALFFVPAGTFNWPEAWLYIAMLTAYFACLVFYLKKHCPELLEKRTKMVGEKSWDNAAVGLAGVFIFASLIVSALEYGQLRGSAVPLEVRALGFVFIALSCIGLFFVMKENAYLMRIVKIQKGQKVVSTGPYQIVRHPMYAIVMVMFSFTPLALGSLYGVLPALISDLFVIMRTYKEDRMLHGELPGYKEYAEKTRYRLVPGIW